MANQIRDDLVEIVGEEEAIGKRIGADILRKKKRLPLIFFLQYNGKYAHTLQNLRLTERDVERIISEMHYTGIVDSSAHQINQLIEKALAQLDSIAENKWLEVLKYLTLCLAEFSQGVAKKG